MPGDTAMAKKQTGGGTSGGVSTNYGMGKLTDGTAITFLSPVVGGVIDKLNATIQTPTSLKGRKITRTSTTTNIWSLV